MAEHLEGCPRYKDWVDVQKGNALVLKRQRTLHEDVVIRIPEDRKKQIDKELA
jgi:hypothetical protein